MKILLVDDVQMERIQLAIRLKQLGHTVEVADSGVRALELYPTFEPDLILLDISMPEMNGFEVSSKIREQYPEWVPIIFLSSHDEPTMVANAIEAGGDDYLVKPVDKIVLNSKLIAMQRIAQMRRELKQKSAQLAEANRELEQLAQEDGLTKVKNRRCIDNKLAEMIALHGRHRLSLSLILLDVDMFKPFNDNYGHTEGDECLIQLASLLKELFVRSGEVVGRYGGEEFVIILGHTDQEKAETDAERIKSALEGLAIPHDYSDVSGVVTVSQGVLTLVPTGKETISELYDRVDKQLYLAKQSGRNQYVSIVHNG
ncbi:diguanylate cyclase [Vibrio aquaticus]|uniref:diguanylate cyclase n=1 Tax=Vibrio aquaticus TaxID=2496559 RepID=A0A432D086_9VIBR|nr:diguanylate cyclase [Vibrio aquaticus]RTZ17321.1 diguanylate cyclase [Vibrio aquaticus]